MPTSRLTDADLRHFTDLLLAQRAELVTEADLLSGTLAEVRAARSDGTADDEHDPEGPTMSSEWSRLSGVQGELTEKSAQIDRALARIADGTYGVCVRRGEVIGRDRLNARPSAELCIDCAREQEARR